MEKPLKPVCQQHGGPQQSQHAEQHQVFRHQGPGDGGDEGPAEKHRQPPPELMTAQREAVAGEENEGPADALLPDIGGKAVVPGPVRAEEIHQVPGGVIEHHAGQGAAPDGV